MASLFGDQTGLPKTRERQVVYEIESLTPRFNRVARTASTVVVCRVKFWEMAAFVTDMVGRVYMAATSLAPGADKILRRDLPEQNPFDPTQWCTRCEQVEQGGGATVDGVEAGPGADPVSGWPIPKWVKFRCVFETFPFKLYTDAYVDTFAGTDERELYRYVRRSRKSYSKEQQFPGGGFKITGTDQKLMQTSFKVVTFADVQYIHYRVPVANLPTANYDAALGKINDDSWDFGAEEGYGWTAGKLLYEGYDDDDKYFDATGNWVCDVVHSFKFRQIGWNYYYDREASTVLVVRASDGVTPPYSSVDFNTLFQFTA